jgi:hypothetical protein
MTTTPTRRALLAGAAAIPLAVAVQAPAGASAPPDPIFDLIAHQRRTAAAWGSFEDHRNPDLDAALERADATALEKLLRTAPTSMAGVCAVLRYVEAYGNRHDCGPFADFIDGPAHEIGAAGAGFLSSLAAAIERIDAGRGAS